MFSSSPIPSLETLWRFPVRWMGAFGGENICLWDQLDWEIDPQGGMARQVASAIAPARWSHTVLGCGIGLVFSRPSVVRSYAKDCWSWEVSSPETRLQYPGSNYGHKGRLSSTHKPSPNLRRCQEDLATESFENGGASLYGEAILSRKRQLLAIFISWNAESMSRDIARKFAQDRGILLLEESKDLGMDAKQKRFVAELCLKSYRGEPAGAKVWRSPVRFSNGKVVGTIPSRIPNISGFKIRHDLSVSHISFGGEPISYQYYGAPFSRLPVTIKLICKSLLGVKYRNGMFRYSRQTWVVSGVAPEVTEGRGYISGGSPGMRRDPA